MVEQPKTSLSVVVLGTEAKDRGPDREGWKLLLLPGEEVSADAIPRLEQVLPQLDTQKLYAVPVRLYIGGALVHTRPFSNEAAVRLMHADAGEGEAWSRCHRYVQRGDEGFGVLPEACTVCIHDKRCADLDAFIRERLERMRRSEPSPAGDDFAQAFLRAHELMAARHNAPEEASLGTALALLGAWEQLVTGLRRWDAAGRMESLENTFALPVGTVQRDTEGSPVIRKMIGELERLQRERKEALARTEEAQARAEAVQIELEYTRKELTAMRDSRLWRWTAPLRKLLDRRL